jgi:hypothetical protein
VRTLQDVLTGIETLAAELRQMLYGTVGTVTVDVTALSSLPRGPRGPYRKRGAPHTEKLRKAADMLAQQQPTDRYANNAKRQRGVVIDAQLRKHIAEMAKSGQLTFTVSEIMRRMGARKSQRNAIDRRLFGTPSAFHLTVDRVSKPRLFRIERS